MKNSSALSFEPQLFGPCPVAEAVKTMARSGVEERGAVFTRREVVGFILDLVGYRADEPLHQRRILEPSFGGGDFLFPAVERLLAAYSRATNREPADLKDAVRAVELHSSSYMETGLELEALLQRHGFSPAESQSLRQAWLHQGDFLLTDFEGRFDYVIGNPPYVRQELIPDVLIGEYRRRYRTIFDRADIYIPFIERSLDLLTAEGRLGFICADRWMKNRYGKPLRELVAGSYDLKIYVDMVDTPAFTSEVVAYPGIFVIGRAGDTDRLTRVARRPEITADNLTKLAAQLTCGEAGHGVEKGSIVQAGGEPWIADASTSVEMVRRLEAKFPALEQAGCRVGIGVATGADSAYIGLLAELDVEEDRKLPLVMTRDILTGVINWRGFGVVNPFADDGKLVDLAAYPRLRRYLEARKQEIAGRHVAQKSPANWYRTIDRIYPRLVIKPKLLIPDIKGEAHMVYDAGAFYPHHNLYYITSEEWDLQALQAVLLSGIAHLFIAAYSTKMRGGYLRFQAQYLRRICIPNWNDVPSAIRRTLIAAASGGDRDACDAAVAELYGLSPDDWATVTAREVA